MFGPGKDNPNYDPKDPTKGTIWVDPNSQFAKGLEQGNKDGGTLKFDASSGTFGGTGGDQGRGNSGGDDAVVSGLSGANGSLVILIADSILDKDKVVEYMDKHTHDTDTFHHHCAAVCHAGLAAGGLGYDRGRPSNANQNGPWLMAHGAIDVGHSDNTNLPADYTPQRGDVAVFSGSAHTPIGHMEIYDGRQWVSDTKQTRFSPARNYGGNVTIYRFP